MRLTPVYLTILIWTPATAAPPTETAESVVWVTSTPAKAEVKLDGTVLGRTPLAVTIPEPGKHVLTVNEQGWSTFTRTLTRLAKRLEIEVRLKDLDLEKAQGALTRARGALDKANARLDLAVSSSSADDVDADPRVVKARGAVQAAEVAVVDAETAVYTVKDSRLPDEERAARAKVDQRLAEEARQVKARVDSERGARLFKCYGNGTTQSTSSQAGSGPITTTTQRQIYCSTVSTQDQARTACEKENLRNGCTCTDKAAEVGVCAVYVR